MNTVKLAPFIALAVILTACVKQQPETEEHQTTANPASPPHHQIQVSNRPLTSDQGGSAVIPAQNRLHPLNKRAAYATSMAAADYMIEPEQFNPGMVQTVDRENYQHYSINGIKLVREQAVSTFSVDVDTASYANIRRMLVNEGRLPPHDAVRLEEMINYFGYNYAEPNSSSQPFSISTELSPSPWNDSRHLLQVGLKGFEPAWEKRPDANLVFLVDVSGSMNSPDKLPLVQKSLRLLVKQMTADDLVSLVVYAGAAGTVLEPTAGNKKAKIMAAIDALQAGGSTHGSAGIELAYALAQENIIKGGINRVLIASDGDMNVGTVNIEALKNLIERKRKAGIALTTLGFGSGNYNYALMEQIADVGNGNAAYIDNLREAQKVLVNEMQSTLLTIASDVKIQVEFNPAVVSEYRLIGYENRMLNREDFKNDKVDAGDIGAGHTVTALYEISMVGEGGDQVSPLRYQESNNVKANSAEEIAMIKLRYKHPGNRSSIEVSQIINKQDLSASISNNSDDLRFAASVAGFGQLLQGGKFTANWGYNEALQLARNSRGKDPHGYRSEFIHLIELAQALSSPI